MAKQKIWGSPVITATAPVAVTLKRSPVVPNLQLCQLALR